MASLTSLFPSEFYAQFKAFHELMAIKVREIILVSSPYDAFILEEDGSLAARIINEYSGLNLSLPPRVTRISSARDALALMERKRFDLVMTTPYLEEMDACSLARAAKKIRGNLPVILLGHSIRAIPAAIQNGGCPDIDRVFVWTGNSDLLLAIVKNVEDSLNVDRDTQSAMVRVLILVEDSALYRSTFLPMIYKEIVRQTQAVLEAGINEEHRLLTMRARPKILLAANYEQAVLLYRKYRPYLFAIMSDARFPRNGKLDDEAGFRLLSCVREDIPDVPLLMFSSEPENQYRAESVSATFLNKNDPHLLAGLHDFFLNHLGFGDFTFRMPDGKLIDRARNLRELQEKLPKIPEASLRYHADRNHFFKWIMSRSEIALASRFRAFKTQDFSNMNELRKFIVQSVQASRKWRQKGVVAQFKRRHFDAEVMDFVKIGKGSLGGKARGLAFMCTLLHESGELHEKYPEVRIAIPQTLVISTEGFENFVDMNDLRYLVEDGHTDEEVRERFLRAEMPRWLIKDLRACLEQIRYPLSVRSSSRLEDAHFQPYAGLYETCMIPNNHPDLSRRLEHLIGAIKRVYASTYYEGPKSFSRSTGNAHQEEAMAVVIQQATGAAHGDYFYPDISGVVQSHNYYPVSHMKPEDGIAHIALGMGKTVVEGGRALRFSPRYPAILPQFSTVDDMLENAQRFFYALRISNLPDRFDVRKHADLERRDVDEAEAERPVQTLSSTYIPEEHRIRDSGYGSGARILTFASILKYDLFPLPGLLTDLMELGRKGLGCPVEIEFSVNLTRPGRKEKGKGAFFFLQMRPMVAGQEQQEVQIEPPDLERAFCFSTRSLGNGRGEEITDIVYVKPADFDARATTGMAEEIGRINAGLVKAKRPYLLVGPGRWGSTDPWLGIPVVWRQIAGVRAMVELRNDQIRADPSQGSHFFQNLTSLGIYYATVEEKEEAEDFFDWGWVNGLPAVSETDFLRHVRTDRPFILKADGRTGQCVMMK